MGNPAPLEPATKPGEDLQRHTTGLLKHEKNLEEIIRHLTGIYKAIRQINNS